jgi:hypothetical protein
VTKIEGLKVAGPMYMKELVVQIGVKTLLWQSAIASDDDANRRFLYEGIIEVTLHISYHYLRGKPQIH